MRNRLFDRLVILLFSLLAVAGCCTGHIGPPSDAGAQNWQAFESDIPRKVIDCKGAERGSIQIRRSNTTVRNCKVKGSVRIWGLARNADAEVLKEMSRRPSYVKDVQAAGITGTIIEDTVITGTGSIPLYVGPGSTNTTIRRTLIHGISSSVVVYLGAESFKTIIEDSVLDGTQANREVLAVDASSHNEIRRVKFLHIGGAIYLYRNCGEAGVSRHTTPSYNIIEKNTFEGHPEYVIWVGSRDGRRCYCDLDDDSLYGSGPSDGDHARWNQFLDNDLGGGTIEFGETSEHNILSGNH